MAYERLSDTSKSSGQTLIADGLDSFVQNSIQLFNQQLTIRNQADEANFNSLVLAGTLSLDAQLAYRKEQLQRVADDPQERSRIKSEVASLTGQITQKRFSDEYTGKLQEHAAGVTSLDSIISWLQGQLSSTTDETVKSTINQQLVTQQQARFTAVQNMLKDQTDYALKDTSGTLLATQIARVQDAKATALLNGDNATAANLDLQIQALTQSKQTNGIQRDIQNLAVATVSGASNAITLLDSYNSRIGSADTSTPITMNGTTYANAREFWTYTRDQYLADQGQSGFFSRIDDETKTAIQVKASNNLISPSDISSTSNLYTQLAGRPELSGYLPKIDAAKQDTIQTAADALTAKISATYDQSLDLNKAVADLNALKSQGVNVDTAMSKILTSATALKSSNVTQIVSNAQQLMQANPNLSITDAVTQAIQKGAGVVLSPDQLLNNDPSKIATDVLTANDKGTNTPDKTTTLTPPNATPSAPLPGAPTTPGPAAPGGNYTIKSGDTLSAIAAQHNTTVAALAAANNISDPNKIQAGATLTIPGTQTQAPVQQPTQPSQPAPVAPTAPTAPKPVSQPTQTVVTAPKPATVPVANPTPTPTSPSVASSTYTIKSGDTLGAIAAAHGTTITKLAALNNITDPNKIYAGATIKLQ